MFQLLIGILIKNTKAYVHFLLRMYICLKKHF